MENLPTVSVIIPVFNDSKSLTASLEAIRCQTYPNSLMEVLVVDNGSTENIKEATNKFPEVKYLLEKEKGPAAARNKGVISSSGEVIAFIDSDCLPQSDWIQEGIKALETDEGCALAGGEIELYYKKKDSANIIELYDTVSYLTQKRYVEEFKFAATANLFAYRRIFDEAGLFLSGIFKGAAGEDTEWGRRVYDRGYKLIYAPGAKVLHPAESSFGGLARKTIRLIQGNHTLGRLLDKRNVKEKVLCKTKDTFLIWAKIFKDIWKDERVKGFYRKVAVSMVAFLVFLFKVLIKTYLVMKDIASSGN